MLLLKWRIWLLCLFAIGLANIPAPVWGRNDIQAADTYIPQLETMLMDNIASFWLNKAIDRNHGGYLIDFDAQGSPRPGGVKMIVTQARTVWFFSRMVRGGYGGDEYLAAAEHGYRFLREKMWDHDNGGFYWEVDATGNSKVSPDKHLYGQAFGLYALSEYYLASKDPNVLDFATQFFHILDKKAHDTEHGGYLEYFRRNWDAPPDTATGYMGVPANMKLMNTHLHLLEAITTFYEASKLPLALERLLELIVIESNTMVLKSFNACTDKYDRNWKRRLDSGWARVSYGHDIENVWLVMKACEIAGVSNSILKDFYETLYDYSYRLGYDHEHGGFFDSGRIGQAADNLQKVWWVQAEALVSALYLYRMTGIKRYLDVFEDTYAFVDNYMADWEVGEWHNTTSASGSGGSGSKGQRWKCGYHNGRAMMECIEVLRWLKTKAEEAEQDRPRRR